MPAVLSQELLVCKFTRLEIVGFTMNEPHVSKIHIEYDDGSLDEIESLPCDFPLFSLKRKKTGAKAKSLGAITGHSIGAFLFFTTSTTTRRDFSEVDALNLMKNQMPADE